MALFPSKQTEQGDASSEVTFLLEERISGQWVNFLSAFSAEMQSQLSADEYRELLRGMGARLSTSVDIGTQDTVEALQASINAQLRKMRWGCCHLTDNGAQLVIEHHWSPLPVALNVDPVLASGFLEGMYEQWFHAAGAERTLTVKVKPDATNPARAVFQFGRHA